MKIEDFLKINIEAYLLKDLQNILKIKVSKGEVGEGSYPMLSSILAGMELLGAIVNPKGSVETINNKLGIDGGKHFQHFWIHYLSQLEKKYVGFGLLFYDLLRNGIVHTFMVKQHIIVFKRHSKHMYCSQSPPQLIVGCQEFFEDFLQTYNKYILPILKTENKFTHANRDIMQANLDEMLDLYSGEADTQFKNLVLSKYTPILRTPITPISPASVSPQEMSEFINLSGGSTTPSEINWPPKTKS